MRRERAVAGEQVETRGSGGKPGAASETRSGQKKAGAQPAPAEPIDARLKGAAKEAFQQMGED